MTKTAVVICGRFNPPTKGHYYLINYAQKYAGEHGYDFWLLPTRTEGNKDNPIPYDMKVEILQELFPCANIVNDKQVHHLFDLVEMLRCYDYDHFIGIGDEERRDYYERVEDLEYISLGDRKPDSDGLLGISATKVRNFAMKSDLNNYSRMMPDNMKTSRLIECYNKIREYSNEK